MNNVILSLIPATGMIMVAIAAVLFWHRFGKLQLRWYWVGAGLWTVAVALKFTCAFLANKAVMAYLKTQFSERVFISLSGLFIGIQSSVFEIGLTLLAVLIWKKFGSNANRAIGIGIGAGAFEALLLGLASLISIILYLAKLPGTEPIGDGINTVAKATPVFWLVGPFERIIAIGCHTASRALVLLGATRSRPMMVIYGFILFTLLDSIAGGAHVSGAIGKISMWWIELMLLPFFIVSIPIIKWCMAKWNEEPEQRGTHKESQSPEEGKEKDIIDTDI